METSLTGRKCTVNHREWLGQEMTVIALGNRTKYNEDYHDFSETVVILEAPDGQIVSVLPDQVKMKK